MIKLLLLAVVPFVSEHRYVTPRTEVTTNLYGSVTGVVDKTYINLKESDPTVPNWAKSELADPATVTTAGRAADALKVKEALAEKRGMTDRTFVNPGSTFPFSIEKWVVRDGRFEFVLNSSLRIWEINTGASYPWIRGEKTSDGWRFEFWDVLDEPELLSSWSGSDITNASLDDGYITPVIIPDTLALISDIKPEKDPVFSLWRTNTQSVAVGDGPVASGLTSIAVGYHPTASGNYSIAVGRWTSAMSTSGLAVGNGAVSSGTSASAIGASARADANSATQIGFGQNSTPNSLQFRGTTVVDSNGQIPVSSLDTPVRSIYDDNVYAEQNGSFGSWSWNDAAFSGVIPRYGVDRLNSWSVQLPNGYSFDGSSTAIVDSGMDTTYIAFVAHYNGEDILITAKRERTAPIPTGDKFIRQSEVDSTVNANLNKYVDGETGIEYVGKYYGGNLYYVPTGNVYPPNN